MKLLILQIILIVLKLVGLITFGWLVILIPMTIGGILLTLLVASIQIVIRLTINSKEGRSKAMEKLNDPFYSLMDKLNKK